MSKWIEFSRKVNHPIHGSNTPAVSSIKSPSMTKAVYFSTTGKALTSDSVADMLVAAEDEVIYSDSSSPGDVFEGPFQDTSITLDVPDGIFDYLQSDNTKTGGLTVNNHELYFQSEMPTNPKAGAFLFKSE